MRWSGIPWESYLTDYVVFSVVTRYNIDRENFNTGGKISKPVALGQWRKDVCLLPRQWKYEGRAK